MTFSFHFSKILGTKNPEDSDQEMASNEDGNSQENRSKPALDEESDENNSSSGVEIEGVCTVLSILKAFSWVQTVFNKTLIIFNYF